MHKVLIIDGIDNVGKSTAIKKLSELYDVVLMNSSDYDFDKFRGPMKAFHKSEDISLINDIISPSRLQPYLRQIYDQTTNSTKDKIFVFDRLLLAPIVYGNVLRHKEFNDIWKDNSYKRYIQSFIDSLAQHDNIKLIHIVALRHDNFVFEDDIKNYLVKIYATQLELANVMFNKYANEFETIKVFIEKDNFDILTDAVIGLVNNS